MKQYLILAVALATHIIGHSQQNPAALNPLLSKTPFAGIGDEFVFSFQVGNNGTLPISGVGDFNRMRFDLTLNKCLPKDSLAPTFSAMGTDVISGSALEYFDITYNASINTFTGIQKEGASLGVLDMKTFFVPAIVTGESNSPNAAQIGGSVDVTPNVTAQAANQTEVDDDIAFFTYSLTVLPVTGLDLKAVLDNSGKAMLGWHTFTETNADYFQIERSDNGTDFYAVGKIPAVGNSNNINSYTFTDPSTFSLTAFYRIRLYDKNGRISISNIETLTKIIKGIGLFPNPAKNFVTVIGLADQQVLILSDYKGAKLKQINVSGSSQRINIEGYAAGTYLIQILQEGKMISTKKFIKN